MQSFDTPKYQTFAVLNGTLARPDEEISGELTELLHVAKAQADRFRNRYPHAARVVVLNNTNQVVYEAK